MYKCPYCVHGRFGKDGWEAAKQHIKEKHLNGQRKKKSGTVRRRSRHISDGLDHLLLEDEEVRYPEEEEEPILA